MVKFDPFASQSYGPGTSGAIFAIYALRSEEIKIGPMSSAIGSYPSLVVFCPECGEVWLRRHVFVSVDITGEVGRMPWAGEAAKCGECGEGSIAFNHRLWLSNTIEMTPELLDYEMALLAKETQVDARSDS